MNLKSMLLFLLLPLATVAQDDQWWNEIHGRTPDMPEWRAWMIISPGYLGINALPIPTQLKGEIPRRPEAEMGVDLHFLPGERAQNGYFRYLHPFADGRIAVEIFGVPYEWYQHNETIRDERLSRVKSGKGGGFGDLYFSTHILLLNYPKLPSLVLRMSCKTASGDLAGARFTDTPGYWFDLSTGKTIQLGTCKIRPFAMAGFYVWQTTSDGLLQNDAALWGAGFDFSVNRFRIEQSVQGYNGWREEKDCPANYRLIGAIPVRKSELKIEYQHGLRDVLYKSVRVSYVQRF